jgi:methionyl-tRNA formyltransferase
VTEGPIRSVFIGSGAFGRETLRRLAADPQVKLVGVISAPPRPSGRHGRSTPTPIHTLADSLAVATVLTPERLRAADALADVTALRPDLVVLADYGQIVPQELLALRHGALNLHPSLLPRHRGATPIPAAIVAGDRETGVSLMRMDAGLDTGPIIAQVRRPLTGSETTPQLEADLETTAADLLEQHLGPWLRGERVAVPQAESGATLTRPLRREDGRLDPARTAVELDRQVRAYQPWPGTFVDTPLGRLVVRATRPGARPGEAAPGGGERRPAGTFDRDGLIVGTGERLVLVEVQPAGGRPMTWDAYLRGRPTVIGSQVVAGP